MTHNAAPGWLARFQARFDTQLMLPPDAEVTLAASGCVGGEQLTLTLQALANSRLPFASAHFPLHADAPERARQLALLHHQLLDLDGTRQMQSLGGLWRQRAYRLGLKLREANAQVLGPGWPWDCGFLRPDVDLVRALAQFQPRRPSLLAAWQLPEAVAETVLHSLQAGTPAGGHPVRLLICQANQASMDG